MISHQEDINKNSRHKLVFITLLAWKNMALSLCDVNFPQQKQKTSRFKLLISAFSVRQVKQHHATTPSPNRCAQRVRHKGSMRVSGRVKKSKSSGVNDDTGGVSFPTSSI